MRSDPRTFARRVVSPAMRFQIVFVSIVLVIGTLVAFKKSNGIDLSAAWLICLGPFAFLIYLTFGYQLMWDDERVYMRQDGAFRWYRRREETWIRIADIEGIEGRFDKGAAIKAKFMPFDAMLIVGKFVGPQPDIMINPHFIHVNSVRELLHHIDHRKPGVLAPEVIAFMHSDKPF